MQYTTMYVLCNVPSRHAACRLALHGVHAHRMGESAVTAGEPMPEEYAGAPNAPETLDFFGRHLHDTKEVPIVDQTQRSHPSSVVLFARSNVGVNVNHTAGWNSQAYFCCLSWSHAIGLDWPWWSCANVACRLNNSRVEATLITLLAMDGS
ncbi:hypothetical protein EJ05DRAFT_163210 [Pseudovirgaria hyperparasitica]|uniref:Uncharacterized protein n=1 Tax=Pseudovirgaria hyperparasitica TaxID=470096 RepID=A0A6A6VW81_9PEZI|nr:uncharacterized protein EJ05DRAFT_163210 [Pseudovirgaria hyperparasitica]KAF2754046.1 hypothetical protein EJ05DRAFT_163210 [Pseudovirgaria hyperparasitica]